MTRKPEGADAGAAHGGTFTTTRHGPATARRAATSRRLAREARQRRLAYIALFGVIVVVAATLVVGALWQFVISPAQAVATVNGLTIRNDVFQRYQKFETNVLTNQAGQLQAEISKLQADKKHAAANGPFISQLQQQLQQVQSYQANIPAYTLSQMERALELRQAAAKIGAAPTPAQLNTAMANLRKQAGGPVGYAQLLSATGVQPGDLSTYFVAPGVVQQNVTKHFEAKVTATQPEAKARHILVAGKARAQQLATEVRKGANFATLARKYSTDNGLQAGVPLTGTAKLDAQRKSSAFNGGWLRDPSKPFVPNQPTWLTPQTSFVAPVLDAILSMKPGEVRVVHSQFGWHVIQVTQHGTLHLSKAQLTALRQQKGAQDYQQWEATATDSTKNKVVPPDPYVQFPSTTPSG
ncbi:MAG TPA: peptidylprolyl isomerase [Chloroflexota bacterium]|nr:peptidylprolyl isomerase [Chloroflexota bacterium]